jgi:DNA-directed RNA polymerase sigma subunit (sigma70/sigma32)
MAKRSVDIGLAVLSAIRKPHETFSCEQIAGVCGCSKQFINQIERRALAKLRRRLSAYLNE